MDDETTVPDLGPGKIGDLQIRTRERSERILRIIEEIQAETPGTTLVFLCEHGPHQVSIGRCGDDIQQLGLLDMFKTYISLPIAMQLSKPIPSRIVAPDAGALPFRKM